MIRLVAHSRSVFNCLLLINKNQFLFWENECDFYCCAVLCMSWQDHYDWVKRAGCLSLKQIMSRSFAIWLSDLQRALQPEPSSKPFNQSRQTALWPVAKGYIPYGAGRGWPLLCLKGNRETRWPHYNNAALLQPSYFQRDSRQTASSHLPFHFLWTHTGFRWGINGPGSPAQQMSTS